MKSLVMLVLVAVALAEKRPSPTYGTPSYSDEIGIIRDDRVHPDAQGYYSFTVETEDGIHREESGGEGGSQQGTYSYTSPDGTPIHLTFVANEGGFQPHGDHLPVEPEFPHPIPQFVLDQIAKAAEEDRGTSREIPPADTVLPLHTSRLVQPYPELYVRQLLNQYSFLSEG